VQVFGLDGDQATRAAQRFFKERRIAISYVDLRRRRLAPAELRRFVDRLGARALIDPESRAYKAAGLAYLRMDDAEILERITTEPALLRLPLIRFETRRPGSAGSAAARDRPRREDTSRHDERHPGDRPERVADHEARALQQPAALSDPHEPHEHQDRDDHPARPLHRRYPPAAILGA
jgi:arsenate reductase-like glutaredoxin family protein